MLTREETIVQFVRDNPGKSGVEIANALNQDPFRIPPTTTFSCLTALWKRSLLLRTGKRRSYTYTVQTTQPETETDTETADEK